MKRQKKTELKPRMTGYWLAALLPLLGIAAFYLMARYTDLLAGINARFSRPALDAMGRFFSKIPVSFMELDIALLALLILLFFILLIRRLIRGPHRAISLLRFVLTAVCAAGLIWNGYCWLWNAGYHADNFSELSGMKSQGVSAEELADACAYFLDRCNELAPQMPRDEEGITDCSLEQLLTEYQGLYDGLEEEFPFLEGQTTRPKGVIFSNIMSKLSFTGIFFPLSGETYINTDQPDWCIPATVTHEIAHQRGIHPEAECNYLGIVACLESDDPLYQYSGASSALLHLSNALYKADREAWAQIRGGFCQELEADWAANTRYWQEQEGTVSKVSDKVYDSFLKSNTQTSGLKSYGECVDLLVLWLETSDYSPMK